MKQDSNFRLNKQAKRWLAQELDPARRGELRRIFIDEQISAARRFTPKEIKETVGHDSSD